MGKTVWAKLMQTSVARANLDVQHQSDCEQCLTCLLTKLWLLQRQETINCRWIWRTDCIVTTIYLVQHIKLWWVESMHIYVTASEITEGLILHFAKRRTHLGKIGGQDLAAFVNIFFGRRWRQSFAKTRLMLSEQEWKIAEMIFRLWQVPASLQIGIQEEKLFLTVLSLSCENEYPYLKMNEK